MGNWIPGLTSYLSIMILLSGFNRFLPSTVHAVSLAFAAREDIVGRSSQRLET